MDFKSVNLTALLGVAMKEIGNMVANPQLRRTSKHINGHTPKGTEPRMVKRPKSKAHTRRF